MPPRLEASPLAERGPLLGAIRCALDDLEPRLLDGARRSRLGSGMADAEVLELAGREVRITSPDKVLFAERGETKLDLVRYYAAVAEPLMRTMGGRPVLMQRFPQGASGKGFFQKRVPDERAGVARDDDGADGQRHALAGARDRRRRARGLGGQPRRASASTSGPHGRRSRARGRAAPGPGPAAGHRLPEAREAAHELKALLDELGHRRLSEDDRQPRAARLRPAAAALGLLRGALGRGGRRRASWSAAAPTSSPRPGGRRSAASGSSSTTTRTRRTRPCSAPGRCGPARARRSRRRCAGRSSTTIDPDELDARDRAGPAGARRRSVGRDRGPQSLEPLLEMHERDTANGLMDAPWPPVYPKQPNEPPRVAPSRARAEPRTPG